MKTSAKGTNGSIEMKNTKDKPSGKVGERQPKATLRSLKNYYANFLKEKQKRGLI